MSESDTVHDVVRLVVHQLQFDVFLVSSYHLAGTIIVHIQGCENRLVVLRTKWVELLQVEEKLRSDVSEVQLCINLDGSVGLLRKMWLVTYSSNRLVNSGTFSTFMDKPAA